MRKEKLFAEFLALNKQEKFQHFQALGTSTPQHVPRVKDAAVARCEFLAPTRNTTFLRPHLKAFRPSRLLHPSTVLHVLHDF